MTNLFTQAQAAHQAKQTSDAEQRENERREAALQRQARRFEAAQMTADYVANLLGFGPATGKIAVDLDCPNPNRSIGANFTWEGGDWCVEFGDDVFDDDVFDLDTYNRAEVVAGRRAGLYLFFRVRDGWFHVTSLAALGARLSEPDCAHLATEPSEARDE